MPTTSATTAGSFKKFHDAFEADGARAALSELLALTDYRYIGIWRFHDGRSAPALHFDRENPGQTHVADVPESATYCTLVRDGKKPFSTADSLRDTRLAGHPAREVVRTYCGVPLMDSAGTVLGTLCHYDLVPRDPGQINTELMLMVSSFLVLNGHVPAYPDSAG
jgi:GAF domain-containing protein